MAAAPSRSTSSRSSPKTGMALVLYVSTGTRLSSARLVGWFTTRRPLSRTSVLPTPRLRRLTEPTSPRAAFELLGRYELLNVTSPSCGIERNSSSPLTAAVAAICCSSTIVTGRAAVFFAPLICDPTTTMSDAGAAAPGSALTAASTAAFEGARRSSPTCCGAGAVWTKLTGASDAVSTGMTRTVRGPV